MNIIGGRLLRMENKRWWVCIHEKHWSDDQMLDDNPRDDSDICWECIDEAGTFEKDGQRV